MHFLSYQIFVNLACSLIFLNSNMSRQKVDNIEEEDSQEQMQDEEAIYNEDGVLKCYLFDLFR